jgi:hypothetical protein
MQEPSTYESKSGEIRVVHVSTGRPDREWLEYQLINLDKSQLQIASEWNTSRDTVRNWCKRVGLNLAGRHYHKPRMIDNDDPPCKIYGDANKASAGDRWKMPGRAWMINQYVTLDKSSAQISREVGTSHHLVLQWVREANITVRDTERKALRHSKRMSGTANPAYTNGNTQRYIARKLEKANPRICEWCNTKKDVQIHHIDHNRQHNEVDNLMWLCGACNRLESNIWILYKSGRATFEHTDNQVIVTFKGV